MPIDDKPIWLHANQPFPDVAQAEGANSLAPGLLALGGDLGVARLLDAYRRGIFPWFGQGQPIMWWSPDPRMVLDVNDFKLHRSLKRKIIQFAALPHAQVKVDTAFDQVIEACAGAPRRGQRGTWILPKMVKAYGNLHRAGHAHSVEVWIDGSLVGGLYCVAIGRAVFGESMFTRVPDASKIALAALVALCHIHQVQLIDCQQNTQHLASMGAREIHRVDFLRVVADNIVRPSMDWQFKPVYWSTVLQTGFDRCDRP